MPLTEPPRPFKGMPGLSDPQLGRSVGWNAVLEQVRRTYPTTPPPSVSRRTAAGWFAVSFLAGYGLGEIVRWAL